VRPAHALVQDVYVTLDLGAELPGPKPKGKPRGKAGADAANAHALTQLQGSGETSTPRDDTPASTTPAPITSNVDASTHDATKAATSNASSKSTNARRQRENEADNEKIQIVDLHGTNPLVSYKGRTYSCHWASSVGSDLFFAKADPSSDTKPLRSLKGHELLGLSSAKLIATPAQLLSRGDEETFDQWTTPKNNDPAIRNQTSFLNRLAALRQKRVHDNGPAAMTPFSSQSEQTKMANSGTAIDTAHSDRLVSRGSTFNPSVAANTTHALAPSTALQQLDTADRTDVLSQARPPIFGEERPAQDATNHTTANGHVTGDAVSAFHASAPTPALPGETNSEEAQGPQKSSTSESYEPTNGGITRGEQDRPRGTGAQEDEEMEAIRT